MMAAAVTSSACGWWMRMMAGVVFFFNFRNLFLEGSVVETYDNIDYPRWSSDMRPQYPRVAAPRIHCCAAPSRHRPPRARRTRCRHRRLPYVAAPPRHRPPRPASALDADAAGRRPAGPRIHPCAAALRRAVLAGVEVDGVRVEEAFFRGRKLHGATVALPDGYRGYVLEKSGGKDTQSVDGEVSNFVSCAEFQNITYWNHDTTPSAEDPLPRCFHWLTIANAFRGHYDTKQRASSTADLLHLHQPGERWACSINCSPRRWQQLVLAYDPKPFWRESTTGQKHQEKRRSRSIWSCRMTGMYRRFLCEVTTSRLSR